MSQKLYFVNNINSHPFHVLTSSKLPIFLSTFAGLLATTFVTKLHNVSFSNSADFSWAAYNILSPFFSTSLYDIVSFDKLVLFFLSLIVITMGSWSYNLINESTVEGHHTQRVQKALMYGMLLFLVSEAMLFFPFFWAFFHGALSPAISIGGVWPPIGIKDVEVLDAFMLPLVNTIVLLSSGVALVSAHRGIVSGHKSVVLNMLYLAISLGIFFSWLQFIEYGLTQFSISDGLYGSVFFMLTGLHGFHVIVGTTLLLISYWRVIANTFSTNHHIGFETAAWYWHFVDIVWLFVFAFIYVWGV